MSLARRYALTTMLMVAIALGATLWEGRPQPAASRPRGATTARAVPPRPVLAQDVLAQSEGLGLTVTQRERLEALALHWREEGQPLQDRARRATEDVAAAARAADRMSLQGLEDRGTAMSEVSRELREHYRAHGVAVRAVLDARQWRRVAETGGQ